MSTLFMQAGNGLFNGAAGMPLLAVIENPLSKFGVNWYDFTSQAIAFLIIAWILNKFVFKTVMKTVADRQKEAEEAVANSERIRRELQAVEEARKEVLHKAQEQADRFVSEAKANVAELLNQEKIRCEQLGTEMLTKAREDARLDQARLKTELKAELATMIVNLTAKLAQMNLTAADRDRLLQAAISEIAAEPSQE
jgi:F-type H+-transporting ATPase subunit b